MILIFACLIAGIIAGVVGSLVIFAMAWRDEKAECDLADLMIDLEPDETPFMSEMQRHREAHLSARREEEE